MAKYGGKRKSHNERKLKSFQGRYGMNRTDYHNLKKDDSSKAHQIRMRVQVKK